MGIRLQTLARLAVHQPQPAIEPPDQQRAPVARSADARHARPHDVRGAATRAHVVGPDAPIDTAGDDLGRAAGAGDACHAVARLGQRLHRLLRVVGPQVPDPHAGVEAAAYEEVLVLAVGGGGGRAGESDAVDPRRVAPLRRAPEPPDRLRRAHVPEEHEAVAARGGEARVR